MVLVLEIQLDTRVIIPGFPFLSNYQAFAGIPQEYRNSRRNQKLLKGKGKFGLNL